MAALLAGGTHRFLADIDRALARLAAADYSKRESMSFPDLGLTSGRTAGRADLFRLRQQRDLRKRADRGSASSDPGESGRRRLSSESRASFKMSDDVLLVID